MVAYTGYLRALKRKYVGYDFKPIARIRMDKFVELLDQYLTASCL